MPARRVATSAARVGAAKRSAATTATVANPGAAALAIAGRWVAVAWTTRNELSLPATLTSGQCFTWRPRTVAAPCPASPLSTRPSTSIEPARRRSTRASTSSATIGGAAAAPTAVTETWCGLVGQVALELATSDAPVHEDSGVLCPAAAPLAVDPLRWPTLSPRQVRLGGGPCLLLARTWNSAVVPLPNIMCSASAASSLVGAADHLGTHLRTPDDLALLVRRYFRLEDDLLAAWEEEWLPVADHSETANSVDAEETRKAGRGSGRASVVDADRRLPRDNVALRELLRRNALTVLQQQQRQEQQQQQQLQSGASADGPPDAAGSRPRAVWSPPPGANNGGTATAAQSLSPGQLPPPYGVRLLRQDPHETLLGFLCSQNNHQSRISGMMLALADRYGPSVALHPNANFPPEWCKAGRDGPNKADAAAAAALPSVAQLLAHATDEQLRAMGFGYRAKYIVGMARHVSTATASGDSQQQQEQGQQQDADGGFARTVVTPAPTLADQRAALMAIPGVGRKVADCILLFAYDRLDIVPIDTHMAQITTLAAADSWGPPKKEGSRRQPAPKKANEQSPQRRGKDKAADDRGGDKADVVSLTPRVHDSFQAHYRAVFGPKTGWAHCFLFAPRLRTSTIAITRSPESK